MREMTTFCECGDPSHIMQFTLFQDDVFPELYLNVQLNPKHSWWRRLGYALVYICGRRSRFGYGHWDCGSLSPASVESLITLLDSFVEASHAIDREGA